jgi:tRNA pseudouridine55 synthase
MRAGSADLLRWHLGSTRWIRMLLRRAACQLANSSRGRAGHGQLPAPFARSTTLARPRHWPALGCGCESQRQFATSAAARRDDPNRSQSKPRGSQRRRGGGSRGSDRRRGDSSARGVRRAEQQRQETLAPSGVLIIDKPVGPTSADIIRVVSRAYGRRKGVGHSGTLDPFASGVLVVCVGRGATRLVPYLQRNGDKEYIAEILLGEETDTLDNTGDVVATAEVPTGLCAADVSAVLDSMVGTVMQVPPIHSALKLNGKKAYELARRGEAVELAPRPVELRAAELLEMAECGTRLRVRIRTGSGFYVRSLARDLAVALGTVGRLDGLRRTENGLFRVEEAVSLDDIRASTADPDTPPPPLMEPAEALRSAVPLVLDERGLDDVSRGRCPRGLEIPAEAEPAQGASAAQDGDEEEDTAGSGRLVKLLGPKGELVALAETSRGSTRVDSLAAVFITRHQ